MEISHRHHPLNPHARSQRIIGPIRKGTAVNPLYPDFEPLALASTNRIGSANFRALNHLAEGQILALGEIKVSCIIFRFKGDHDGITNCILNTGHYQRMKFSHFIPLNAFEIVKGLMTRVAPPVGLARG